MNSTLDFLKLALKDVDILSNYLQVCKDSKLFQRKDYSTDELISFINSSLNISDDYESALLILDVFIHQCSLDVLGRHLMFWLQHCLKILQLFNQSFAVYGVLRGLLMYSKHFPDIRKQISKNIIPKLLDHFFKNSNRFKNKPEFLLYLEEILVQYGRPCVNSKVRLEKFLLSLLESHLDVAHISAKCFMKLITVGIVNSDGEIFKEAWCNKQKFLINALHSNLDNLLNNVIEIQGTYENYIIPDQKVEVPQIEEKSPLKRSQRLTTQFVNLTEFLRVLLLDKFEEAKRIYHEAILNVICRGLSVTCNTLEANVSSDSVILSTQIPTIQRSCINILDALIRSCQRNLISHGKLICKVLTQTLKWTTAKENVYGQDKPYSLLRVDAYNCLSTWLTISRIGSNVEHYVNELISCVILDIHSEEPTISLDLTAKRLKGKVGKKERKLFKQRLDMSINMPEAKVNEQANKEICEAALNLLPCLLEAASLEIPPKIHKKLQEIIISELMVIQGARVSPCKLPIPYNDELCRLSLYKALLGLCNKPHPKFSAPCNYADEIFNEGINDNSMMIARFCGQAIANIDHMMLPLGPMFCLSQLTLGKEDSLSKKDSVKVSEFQEIMNKGLIQDEPTTNNGPTTARDNSILESISSSFENKSIETSKEVNKTSPKINVAINRIIKEINTLEETSATVVIEDENENICNKEVAIETVDNNKENVESKTKNNELVDAGKDNNSARNKREIENKKPVSEKENPKRRASGDMIDLHKEKKMKNEENSSSLKCNYDDDNELEAEMLSSFVDLVK